MKRIAIIAAGLFCAACAGEAPPEAESQPTAAYAQAEHGDFTLTYEVTEPEREMKAAYATGIDADEGAALGDVASYSVDRYGRILEAAPRDPGLVPADAPPEARWGEPVV